MQLLGGWWYGRKNGKINLLEKLLNKMAIDHIQQHSWDDLARNKGKAVPCLQNQGRSLQNIP
jgi:hypothetical protein